MDADGIEVRSHTGEPETLPENRRARLPRLQRSEHYDVTATGIPDFNIRKHRIERAQNQTDDAIVHFIDMKPLGHDAAGFQPAGGEFVNSRLNTLPMPTSTDLKAAR